MGSERRIRKLLIIIVVVSLALAIALVILAPYIIGLARLYNVGKLELASIMLYVYSIPVGYVFLAVISVYILRSCVSG